MRKSKGAWHIARRRGKTVYRWKPRGRKARRRHVVREAKQITPAEQTAALAALAGETSRNRALVRVLFQAGLRRAEAAALDCGDLHLTGDSPYLTVRHGKGDVLRDVKLTAATVAALVEYVGLRREGPVFRSRVRGPAGDRRMTGQAVWHVVDVLARRAGLRHLSPHMFRHACAGNLSAVGTPIAQIALHLGHQDVRQCAAYISQVDRSSRSYLEAADALPAGGEARKPGRGMSPARKAELLAEMLAEERARRQAGL